MPLRDTLYLGLGLCLLLVAGSCGDDDRSSTAEPEAWTVGVALPSLDRVDEDGYRDVRGIIHSHSYFSHDACDDMPVVDGVRNEPCFGDLRRGMCQTKHDFVMLTDHPSDFRESEFTDALLYRPDRGDELVIRDGAPVASRAGCPDGAPILVMAGSESNRVMPVGLEGHVSDDIDDRGAAYSSDTPENAARLRAQGAVVLVAHPEMYTVDELAARDIDGFEMYNLHANLLRRDSLGVALRLLQRLAANDPDLPHPDLALMPIVVEDERYLERWGSLLARGLHRVTTMGTDAHRNSLPTLMQDGERVDSYRRMLLWFTNHLLIQPEANGSWDDRHVKEALRSGRHYGAFEMLGYPDGFSYTPDSDNGHAAMGDTVALADDPTFTVRIPSVRGIEDGREAPAMQARILRAVEGGFEEVASGTADLTFAPTIAGAYRAEIRMVPYHLREDLGGDAEELLARDYVWIYGNAIYVR